MQPAFAIITYAGECWSVWDTADTDFCCYEDLYMLVNLPLDDGLDGLSYILHFYIISIYTRSVMASGICPRKAREIRCYMICFITHVHQLPSAHYHEKYHLPDFAYVIIQLPPERRGYSPPFSLCSSLTRIFLTLTAFPGKKVSSGPEPISQIYG